MSTATTTACKFDLSILTTFETDCIGFYISKVLGLVILLGSFALKLPQIINIIVKKNVIGLSANAFYTEVPLSITTIVYNYLQHNPFTSYGETCIISIQNMILVILLWMYMKPTPSIPTIISILFMFLMVAIVSLSLPSEYQYLLPLTTLPLMIYSRTAQIITNIKLGTTGQLSLITTFLQFGGSLARIFTTIQEVGLDISLLSVFLLSVVLNGILMGQIIYYSYMKKQPVKDKKKQ